jgi:hypothetical protein
MPSTAFRIHNPDVKMPDRHCPSLLSPGEEDQFTEAGFVIADRRLPPAAVAALGNAVDALAAAPFSSPAEKTYQDEFPGQYIRDPHKADPRAPRHASPTARRRSRRHHRPGLPRPSRPADRTAVRPAGQPPHAGPACCLHQAAGCPAGGQPSWTDG